jgi:hypothetical protein
MATVKKTQVELPLLVRDADLEAKTLDAVRAARRGDQVLGLGDALIADHVPKAVLRRVTKLIPPEEFSITEITMKFTLGGELLGVKVSGDVSVKVVPKKPSSAPP